MTRARSESAPVVDFRRTNALPASGPAAGAALARQTGAGPAALVAARAPSVGEGGEFTFDYVDSDVREIVRTVLGDILRVTYSIDANVQGVATVRVSTPISRDQLLPTLASVLAQNGIAITQQNGAWRVSYGDLPPGVPPVVDARAAGAGAVRLPLRYAAAQRLAAMLEPYAGEVGRVQADPAQNALIITGAAAARENLIELARIFDVDFLANQSYAMFAVRNGDPRKVAGDLKQLFQSEGNGALAGAVNVVPIERANAILVIATQQAYVDRAGRFIAQVDQVERIAGRKVHIYYVQNGQAADLQPVLQRAFGTPAPAGGLPGGLSPAFEPVQIAAPAPPPPSVAAPPLPGTGPRPGSTGLGTTQDELPPLSPGADVEAAAGNGIRILADRKRNALLVMATDAEYATVEAAIRKLDVLPLQVLIEATIAEVTLNDALRYGTQFFFNEGGNRFGLTNAGSNPTVLGSSGVIPAAAAFGGLIAPAFPAFYVARTVGSMQFAIQALQNVTDVKVVSSPKLLIMDNERARLQVGDLVPVITQSATAVSAPGAPIINSVDYRETGVILSVTPRINAGGLVTLDIEQEVSDVVTTTTSTINSPTFQQRKIRSRVVIQDGDTIGLGGLIRDTKAKGNAGLPVLRDIPLVGPLFSTRREDAARTELLILITPRVVRDQRDTLVLTEELRRKLAPASRLLEPPAPPPPAAPVPATLPVAAAVPPPPPPRPAR